MEPEVKPVEKSKLLSDSLKSRLVSLAKDASLSKFPVPLPDIKVSPKKPLPETDKKRTVLPSVLPPIERKKKTSDPLAVDAMTFIKTSKLAEWDGFVYLRPTKSINMKRNLYDLQVVAFDELDKSNGFVTLSRHVSLSYQLYLS
jgi:hypothetical protein